MRAFPHITRYVLTLLSVVGSPAAAQTASDSTRLAAGIAQLRHAVGTWSVVTEFLHEDGSVARSADGEYTFQWVVSDRVVSGRSTIPALDQASGILFYVTPRTTTITMTSVGADGMLWIMTGDAGGETRYTQEFDARDGGRAQLRFTRCNVEPHRFESHMEYTNDGGRTWKPGNHQVFTRRQ